MLLTSSLRLVTRLVAEKPVRLASFAGSLQKRFASSRLFTEKHEWLTVKEDICRVGISDHAQDALGDVVYVQLPDIGTKCAQFEEVGAIESVKAASEVLSPISGEVVAVNTQLEEKPSLVNSDCYGEGWLFEVKIDNVKEMDNLMDETQYKKYLEDKAD